MKCWLVKFDKWEGEPFIIDEILEFKNVSERGNYLKPSSQDRIFYYIPEDLHKIPQLWEPIINKAHDTGDGVWEEIVKAYHLYLEEEANGR